MFTKKDGENRIWEKAKSVEKREGRRELEDLEEQVTHNYMFPHVCRGLEEYRGGVRQQGKE